MTVSFLFTGLSAMSVNWFFIIIFTVILAAFLLALSRATKILFSHKQIAAVFLLFPILQFVLMNLPSLFNLPNRRAVIDYFGSATYAARFEEFINVFIYIIVAFLSGLMTKIILQAVTGEKVGIKAALLRIKSWFGRSLLAAGIGFAGSLTILLVYVSIDSPGLWSFWEIFAGGVFNTLTFLLFPLLIGGEGNVYKSTKQALTASVQTAHRWFHLFLALFILTGGFIYIFIPNSWLSPEVTAGLISSSDNISAFNVHISWIGGYALGTSHWYSDAMNKLKMPTSDGVSLYIYFVLSLIATLIKIRVTQILLEAGYLRKELS